MKSLEVDGGDGCMMWMHLLVKMVYKMYFKMVKMAYFVLRVFYHNKENEKGQYLAGLYNSYHKFSWKKANPLLNAKSG